MKELDSDTRIHLTIAQWVALIIFFLGIVGSLLGGSWWLGADREQFKTELTLLRRDLNSSIDTMVGALEKLDVTWQMRVSKVAEEIKAVNVSDVNSLRSEFSLIRERLLLVEQKQILPGSEKRIIQLENDIKQLRKEIKDGN